jgi:hypothetical protein
MQTSFTNRLTTGRLAAGRFSAVILGAAALAFLAAGCHDNTPPPPTVVTSPSATTTVVPSGSTTAPSGTATVPDTKVNTNAGPGGSMGTDSALADQVNTAIVHNKQMTGARVEVVATDNVVTLNGSVQNQQQKALAQSTAQQVPGVGSIKNKLIIVTTGGAKPKPMVVTKTKTVVVHDQAPAASADTAAPDASAPATGQPPAPPASGAGTDQTTPPATGTTGQ